MISRKSLKQKNAGQGIPAEASKNVTGGGEGIEVLKTDEPFDNHQLLGGKYSSGHELEEKQEESNKWRRICRNVQNEMERSLNTQKFPLQEKATIEQESYELQDFLQNEKTAMYDAPKEAEAENQECKKKLEDKENEVKGLQSKYNALETRSKELIVQQNTAVFGSIYGTFRLKFKTG